MKSPRWETSGGETSGGESTGHRFKQRVFLKALNTVSFKQNHMHNSHNVFDTRCVILVIRLSYIFPAKQEISEAYKNVTAKTHVNYFISMSVCLSEIVLSVCGTILCTVV